MKASKNDKVQKFLEELDLMDNAQLSLLNTIREIVLDTHPKAEEKMMYGGIIFFIDTEMFSGVFAYKNHISIEFSQGHLMSDPDKLLEGNGKYRRHLKLKTQEDIAGKQVVTFVKQAI
jgi:hypothetical protein